MSPNLRLVLSVDLEDWNQLVGRQMGDQGWDCPGVAFPRQVDALLQCLEEIGVKATFFVLGMTAKNYPTVVERVSRAGHPLACHGYAHQPIRLQSPPVLRNDLERCIDLLGTISGKRPLGYRAPAFALSVQDVWAFEVMAELGFAYDSSLNDSPRVPRRISPASAGLFDMQLPSGRVLAEFPLAVARLGALRIPVGGGSYWRVFPQAMIKRALGSLRGHGDAAALYFHPYEFDPQPLALAASRGRNLGRRVAEMRYNFRRRGFGSRLQRLAREFSFITCEECLEQHRPASTRTLSGSGSFVR